MKKLMLVHFWIVLSFMVNAQSVSSLTSGYWDDPLIWTSGVVPTFNTTSSIVIAPGHVVTVRDVQTVDGLIISVTGKLIVEDAGQLVIVHDTGIDLNILGDVEIRGGLTGAENSVIASTPSQLLFSDGSVYRHEHATEEGSIPLATWSPLSTCEISGYTTVSDATVSGNWSQAFGNILWNTDGLTVPFNLHGLLNTIQGNYTVASTGSQHLVLSGELTNLPLHVGQDFLLTGSGSVALTNVGDAVYTVFVERDLQINTTGFLRFATSGTGNMAVGRDVQILAGTLDESGQSWGYFLFQNSSLHHFYRGDSGTAGAILGRINYTINAGDTLDVGISVLPAGIGSDNANEFSLFGVLQLGSADPNGSLQNNTTGGNVRTTLLYRTFAPGSTVIYKGASQQVIGNPGASADAGTTVVDNAFGVQVKGSATLSGNLHLKKGELFISDGSTLTLSGSIVYVDGYLDGSATATLMITGLTGGNVDVYMNPESTGIGTLSLDRVGSGASLTLLNTLHVISQLNLIRGDLMNAGWLYVSNGTTISRWAEAQLVGEPPKYAMGAQYSVTYRSNSLPEGPFAKFQTGLELPDAADVLSVLNIKLAQSADTIELTKDISIHTLLDLNRGRFYAGNHTIDFYGPSWSDDTGNFSYTTGTVVFHDTTTIQGTSNSAFHHLLVKPSANLTFNRNSQLAGNFTVEPGGVLQAAQTVFTFTGNEPQTISIQGATISGITFTKSNEADVELGSALNVSGLIRFNSPSSNVEFRTNNLLTLTSSSDTAVSTLKTGMIYRLQSGNTIVGNVTVERFMEGEGRMYRYLSSPVTNATVSSWMDDFPVTGDFTDPSLPQSICGTLINSLAPSLFVYNEPVQGYEAYPQTGQTSSTSLLQPGRGYAAYIRKCDAPTIVDVTGEINQQAVALPVTYTEGADPGLNGWNLVGNPYPCTIDWDTSTGWTKTNISSVIAIRDNGGGGFFRYWDGDGDPADIPLGRISPGQAFWVRATSPSPVLMVNESAKAIQAAEFFREHNCDSVYFVPTITISLKKGSLIDRAYIKLKREGKRSVDGLDAPKLNNALFDLATFSADSVPLAINAIDSLGCTESFALWCNDMTAGIYTLHLNVPNAFTAYEFNLYDKFLNDTFPLHEGGVEFNVATGDASGSPDRFILSMKRKPITSENIHTSRSVYCDHEPVEIQMDNKESDVRYEIWEGEIRYAETLILNSTELSAGIHTIRIKAIGACEERFLEGSVNIRIEKPQIISVKNDEICTAGIPVLEAGSLSTDDALLWFAAKTDTIPVGYGTMFNPGNQVKTTTFYVQARSARGCESERLPVMVHVIHMDSIHIEISGDSLLSSYEYGNQWYFNGSILPADTLSWIRPDKSGGYAVEVKQASCSTRANLEYIITRGEPEYSVGWKFPYPNPVKDWLVQDVNNSGTWRVEDILLAEGKSVINQCPVTYSEGRILIYVGNISPETYVILFRQNNAVRAFRFVKE